MPCYLRKIRKARWLKSSQDITWLRENEIPANPLGDLITTHNQLSVYYVDNQNDASTLERIAAAYAATRDYIANFDYALIDLQYLTELELRPSQTKGETPDDHVNSLHFDIVELSAQKLVSLATVMWHHAERVRISEKDIERLLKQGVSSKQIDPSRIRSDKIKKKLEDPATLP